MKLHVINMICTHEYLLYVSNQPKYLAGKRHGRWHRDVCQDDVSSNGGYHFGPEWEGCFSSLVHLGKKMLMACPSFLCGLVVDLVLNNLTAFWAVLPILLFFFENSIWYIS